MTIVNTTGSLDQLCSDIDCAGKFGIDLEFIPERTYVPQLCLIQVVVNEKSYIVDPLSINTLTELWQKVADPAIAVILHAGEQDLSIIYHLSGLTPANVLDTQIAAGFLGFGYPTGYGTLVRQLLGVTISKTESYTDWLRRPLTDSQVEYALDDVRYLPAMERKLSDMLQVAGRLEWARQECALRCMSPRLFYSNPDLDFTRIKGAASLPRRGLAVLRELFRMREEKAVSANCPPHRIIPDNVLLELARRPIHATKEMEQIRGIRHDQVSQYGDGVVKATKEALNLPDEACPLLLSFRAPSQSDKMKTDVLFLLLKSLCYSANLAPDLVATRYQLEILVRAFRENQAVLENFELLKGWRYDLIGRKLIEALNGGLITLRLNSQGAPVTLELGQAS